jgi:hypothetical protein
MTSVRFNARLDTSHHGRTHPLKNGGVFVDGLTGVHDGNGEVSLCGQQELHTQGFSGVPTGHNPKRECRPCNGSSCTYSSVIINVNGKVPVFN